MIVVSGTVRIKPESRQAAVDAGIEMSRASEAEAGCITYHFYSDIEDENLFRIFEVWTNEEALMAHFKTPHMATFNSKLPDLLAGETDIKRYDISRVSDL